MGGNYQVRVLHVMFVCHHELRHSLQFEWIEGYGDLNPSPGTVALNLFFSSQYNDNIITTVRYMHDLIVKKFM